MKNRRQKRQNHENEFQLTPTANKKLAKHPELSKHNKEVLNDFFRKSRAIYKARIGYSEHQMRGFFGWSETSDAPKHYISLVKEDLEKALAEEYGEEVDYDSGYEEEALRPVECENCGSVCSATRDLCGNCDNALTEQGEVLSRQNSKEVNWKESLKDVARDREMSQQEFDQMLGRPLIEFMQLVAEE